MDASTMIVIISIPVAVIVLVVCVLFIICRCVYGRRGRRWGPASCCCGEERIYNAPAPQYTSPYPVQYAPMYFYPQGYAPPPPPQMVIDERLVAIFRKIDKDNSGSIDINEAVIGAKEFGALGYFLASDEEVKRFFAAADKNKDNRLDYNEFANISRTISVRHPHPLTPQIPSPPRYAPVIDEKLTAIFRKIDKDNSGSIDINEAMIGVKEFGALGYFLASDEEVKAFFAAADKNKDNKLDFQEFSIMAGALAIKHPHPQPPKPSSPVSVVSLPGQPKETTSNSSNNGAVQGGATSAVEPQQIAVTYDSILS